MTQFNQIVQVWQIFLKDVDGNYTEVQANGSTSVKELKVKYGKKNSISP